MLAYYINLILFFLSLFTLIYFKYIQKKNYALLFKITTSILFISTGIISYINSPGDYYYFILLILGLFFSFLGDIFLALKVNHNDGSLNKYFFYGVISFAITHVMYIGAFIHLGSFKILDLLVTLILSFIIISLLKSNKNIDFKNMIIPIRIYSFVICLMTFEAFKLLVLLNFDVGSILRFAGTLLFILSDMVLCFILFYKNPKKFLVAINLITYYVAQFLIASTLLFFE